jgi:hypothetical protein
MPARPSARRGTQAPRAEQQDTAVAAAQHVLVEIAGLAEGRGGDALEIDVVVAGGSAGVRDRQRLGVRPGVLARHHVVLQFLAARRESNLEAGMRRVVETGVELDFDHGEQGEAHELAILRRAPG